MIKPGTSWIAWDEPLVITTTDDAPGPTAFRLARPRGGLVDAQARSPCKSTADVAREARLEELASHLEFLWRFACRMGVGEAAAEDIAQEAFVVAASRLDAILPGKERSYLVSVVVHMVRRERTRRARHEELKGEPSAPTGEQPDSRLDEARARRLLDASLEALDDDLRAVFVLHEIEEETMADIALLLDLAPGTVASRLRRAREAWKRATERLKRGMPVSGGRRP
ncbi:RNA polymerase sigma factor [Sorangium sp. So ce1151]|uniref:RNA polymerase sigma factor n=1 Tax=Sorangium sp. So ce1151 TaxID=3133332 RepID=UPI003F630C88